MTLLISSYRRLGDHALEGEDYCAEGCVRTKSLLTTAGRQLQVFNLATKSKLGSHLMNEDVTFWTWINDTTLGMVTEHSVYHWKVIDGQAAPQKVSMG